MIPAVAMAFNTSGQRWATAPIVMHLQLGASNGTLLDGTPSWGASAEDALATWNANMTNMRFSVVRDSTTPIGFGNSSNNVFWSPTVYGDAWDGRTLAITLSRANVNGARLEADVIFNVNLTWNSYRGPLRPASGGGTLYDFHRVALHEFGHVLGLGHPDDIGQRVAAVMNANTSDTDALTSDDINGARAIYDSGAPVPSAATLYMQSPANYSVSGPTLNLQVARVQNDRPAGSTSGTLRLELWAMPQHFDNGLPTGSRNLGIYTFSSVLSSGFGFPNVNANTTYSAPPAGSYFVALLLTEFTGGSGSGFTIRDFHEFPNQLTVGSAAPPAITAQPASQTVRAGASAAFVVAASGAAPLTFQWFKNGVAIPGATASTYTITSAQPTDAGNYSATITNVSGTATSAIASLVVNYSRLINLSVRSTAGSGSQTLIVGFAIAGGGSKQMLIRGVGPTLASFGVGGALIDPQLRLFNSNSAQINQNDDWGGTVALTNAFTSVGAFGLPGNSRDSALLVSLPGGTYSAQVTSSAGTGVALVEGYDADAGFPGAQLTNLSVRSVAGTDANVLIVGFVISGNSSKTLLIRGIGPTLAGFGVTGVLADPQLQLFNSSGVSINQNDNWGGTVALTSTFTSVGAFSLPANSLDAAMVVTLAPGSYTAQVRGAGTSTGVALVEVYDVP